MRILPSLYLAVLLFASSCGSDHPKPGSSSDGHHRHVAPHGGQLVELGEHGAGFNLELVLNPDGFLSIYVLDAHAEDFVRIPAHSITFDIQENNQSVQRIACNGVADPATGESLGNTSLFISTEPVLEFIPFEAVFTQLEIGEISFARQAFEFSKKSDE